MPLFTNQDGLHFTAASANAVQAYDTTVLSYLAFDTQTGPNLKSLLALDPDMPMAACLKGYFFMLMGVRPLVPRAARIAESLRVKRDSLTKRENLHVAALAAWAADNLADAAAIWATLATRFPRDVMAIKMAHFGLFYVGRSMGMRDNIAQLLDHWCPADAAWPYIMSMYAFALEEAGDPHLAEDTARRALEIQPRDPWGIHAVAHALEARGEQAAGIKFVKSMSTHWQSINNFRYHLTWHKALFEYQRRNHRQALADFDTVVFDPSAGEYLDICNDASLLLRLELAGVDVEDRWQKVADKAAINRDHHMLAFADLHFLLALSRSPNDTHVTQARNLATEISSRARSTAPDAPLFKPAALVADALLAHRDRQFSHAAEQMEAAMPDLHLIGGSHAQRHLFRILLDNAEKRAA